nr:baseplate wedge [uncultured Mediterranean phage uvMED]
MASNKLVVSDFDFDNIKANLKSFLQDQPEFSDYNFEGSGFAVLLDTLAYNTHYLGFNANMLANELYLDSADIRKNVVSLAKMLGYTPTSSKSPLANVDITINNGSGATVTMNKGTSFNSVVDNVNYQFVTNQEIIMTPQNGVYKFSGVDLYEGTLVTFRYTVDSTDVDQRFIIPTVNADTSTLKVTVQNSTTDTTQNTYTLASGLKSLDNTSKAYFLSETDTGKFQIYFGDNVIGKKLSDGNIIIMEYIVTNKDEANGCSSFSLSGSVGGFTNVSIVTNSAAQGGSDPESNESIKFNAPLQYTSQDRAVTTTDYETLVKSIYPNATSISAWGGEDDETPIYGVVKIAVKGQSGVPLTNATKLDIVTKLKSYNVASVRPEIIDPIITSVVLVVNAKFDKNSTTKTADTLKSEITTAISNYNLNTLTAFDGVFRYSKITGLIDNVDNSILSNITTVKIRKTFTPTLNSSTKYDVYFRNAIYNPHSGHESVLSSTGFKISGNTNEMFLDDDGMGNVRVYYLVSGIKTVQNATQGTINYSTGQVTLNSLSVASISNIRGAASTNIEITVSPSSNDVVPVRDQILEIDVENSIVNVNEDTFVGGSSEAGVGYTTSSSY